jgi:CRP/FNR family cyclic AMP-dependent transcriptional regulator
MRSAGLGRTYEHGQVVFRQGDPGDCLFVVQEGEVEVIDETGGRETLLRVAGRNELFGEEVVFECDTRSATVRARGRARVLTISKRNLLRRINEDPSLTFTLMERMCRRIRELSAEVVRLRLQLAAMTREPR